MHNVALVYPVHNALECVIKSFPELVKADPIHIAVINDCSQKPTSDWLLENVLATKIPVSYVFNTRQQLFTRTVNRGIRSVTHLNPEFIGVVNTDCILKDGWLDALVEGMEDPSVGIVGYKDSVDSSSTKPFTEVTPPNYITGHCILLRTKMLEKVGVFLETDTTGIWLPELAPFKGLAHIGSDRMMSYNAHRFGWKTLYCNFGGCEHAAGQSWNHDLAWLSRFNLQPLWEANDTLSEVSYI